MAAQPGKLNWCWLPGLVLLCGCGAPTDEAEKKAVKYIEKLGGSVVRDTKVPGKPVVTVRLTGEQVTDASMKELAALKSLQKLSLEHAQVSDAGLRELAGLKNLADLNLDFTLVTDAGLKDLAVFPSLTTLSLSATGITDAGLKDLSVLKNLKQLYLVFTKVSTAGAQQLQKALPDCKISLTGAKL